MKPTLVHRNSEREFSSELVNSTPSTLTCPRVGFSRPAIRLRRVVLPAPDGPTTATISPASAPKVMLSSALTKFPLAGYSLDTETRSTTSFTDFCIAGVSFQRAGCRLFKLAWQSWRSGKTLFHVLRMGRPILFFRVRVFCPGLFLGVSDDYGLKWAVLPRGKLPRKLPGSPNDHEVK